jgi:hypothetical protein
MTVKADNLDRSQRVLFVSVEEKCVSVRRDEVLTALFWKALAGLFAFDVLGFGNNFSWMHRVVSNWTVCTRENSNKTVDDVCRAVNYACIWYPKRVLCLQRSAVTTCLLRSYGIRASMVIGAQILPFKAHAWTEAEGRVINERRPPGTTMKILDRC